MNGKLNNVIDIVTVDDDKLNCSPSLIKKVTLIVTKGCNLSCDYCFEKHFAKQKMKTEDAFFHIDKYDPEVVKFFGGEPLINRRLIKGVMDRYPDKKYEITTNGIYIHKLDESYWKKFDSINISLDGIFERDVTRWTNEKEYEKTVANIKWLIDLLGNERIILNVTTGQHGIDYVLMDRVKDLYELTDACHFDLNVVVYDADHKLVLTESGREEFIRQCMQLYLFSIAQNGYWDITLNEAMFSTKSSSSTCCVFHKREQAAIDVNGFESFCHVAAYYNISNEEVEEEAKNSDASCIMISLIGKKNDVPLELDYDNFNMINKAEILNNGLFQKRTQQRYILR
jgi:MoaA/NifB/PqqE/SkfB family radical SAM enzyme